MAVLDEAERTGLLRHLRQAAGRGLSDACGRHHAVSLPPPVHRGASRMRLRRLLVVALLLLGAARVPACLAAPQSMVAAANPLAVEAGLDGVAPRRLGGRCRDRRADGAGRRRAAGLGPGRRRLPAALRRRHRRHRRSMTAARRRRPAPRPRCSSAPTASRSASARRWPRASPSACRARSPCSSWPTRSRASWPGTSCSSRRSRWRATASPCRRVWPLAANACRRCATIPACARPTSTPTARPRSWASGSSIRPSPRRCS